MSQVAGSEDRPAEHADVVQFGGSRPRGPRWLSTVLLAALVAAAVVAVSHHPGRHRAPPSPPPPPAVTVTRLGHPLLAVTAGWELFGLGTRELVAIQLSRGRITRTVLPPPEGSGPVSFIVGPHQVIIRPLDNVPGYLVPDGAPARELTGLLAPGSLLLPGPGLADEWIVSGSGSTLVLVGQSGQPTGVHLALPAGQWPVQSAMSDGRGDLLLFSTGGRQYDAGPGRLRPVGALLVAVGPTRWLGLSCGAGTCRNVVIDPANGVRRTLPGPPVKVVTWPWPWQPGAVSPSGATAAVMVAGTGGQARLDLVNLRSGAATVIPAAITQESSSQTLAWSPDGKWLFAVGAGGKLLAVNAGSGRVESLGVRLPAVSQLAIRST
jgi:hypothetical protein